MGRKSKKTYRKENNLFVVQGELQDHQELWMLVQQAESLRPFIYLGNQREVVVHLTSLSMTACIR